MAVRNKSNIVVGRDGLRGEVVGPLPADGRERVTVHLDDGQTLEIPASLLTRRNDGLYEIPLGPREVSPPREARKVHEPSRTAAAPEPQVRAVDEAVVPVLAEELEVGTRAVPAASVRVHRRVLEHEEEIEMPLVREHLDIRRVILDQDVEGPLPVRQEGDTIIVPIVEEVLIIEKRFRLREEVHMTRRAFEETHRERVVVRRQEANIERLDAEGRSLGSIGDDRVTREDSNPQPRIPRRSILGE
jgi:uncharacterized protein (TIGR02271 family)